MYSTEQRRLAIETFIRFGHSYADTIAELGCPDRHMPISWPSSTSPDAGMASPSLPGACRWLDEGDRPKIRPDRGCHYRWPGWMRICDESGLARSMPGKGCSPDSARCEGFFGRLKTEFFHGCGWAGVTIGKFMDMLDACLRWYRDARIKGDLDCRAPCSTAGTWVCWQRRMDSVQDSHRNPFVAKVARR